MLTNEQVVVLRSLEARHHAGTACVVCQPHTEEWRLASQFLQFDSHTPNGDKFRGTGEQLRPFFEQVNEVHRHSADPRPVKSLLCDD